MTAWARGPARQVPQVAAAIWVATAGLVAAARLQLSEPKSGAFAGTGSGRRWLRRRCPEAQLLRPFKDLGVEQHAGMHGCAVLAGRATGTRGRFERIAGLPLPIPRRVQATAASGVSAATHGAITATPPGRQLAVLRTWAGRAIWRGGRHGAVELRLLLASQDCRADPAAALGFAPLLALAKALRKGWATPEDAAALWVSRARHPLAQALRRSFRVLRLGGHSAPVGG